MVKDRKIRVLIVDDSPTARNLLRILISEDPQLEVAGMVADGAAAIAFMERERPDVISMDIYMPVMNGLEATRHIMATTPVPIVIVSSEYNPGESNLSFKALEAGALTILPRPAGPGHQHYHKHGKAYRSTLKSMAEVKVIRRNPKAGHPHTRIPTDQTQHSTAVPEKSASGRGYIVVIGASAGGPAALQALLKSIPPVFPVPVLVVQHIDKGFANGFAHWLEFSSGKRIKIPADGEPLIPGQIYLPAGDLHLGIREEGIAKLSHAAPEFGLRPSVSFLFRSAAQVYGRRTIAILLSGMGQDGATELKHLRDLGAFTLVQDTDTALVYGMPGEAVRLDAVCRIASPDKMAGIIINYLSSLKK